jgi:hypothetical protein
MNDALPETLAYMLQNVTSLHLFSADVYLGLGIGHWALGINSSPPAPPLPHLWES